MEGEQHNTYDIEFYGPNTMCGALYLGALRAAEEMARHLGDPDARRVRAHSTPSGRARYDRELWNGEYYEQHVRMPEPHEVQKGKYPQRHPPAIRQGEDTPRYQYGPGCLADQLLGQWFAHVVGLGHLLPADHVRTCGPLDLPVQLPAVPGRPRELPARLRRQRGGGRSSSARGLAAAARDTPSPTRTSAGRAPSTRSPAS